MSGPGESLQDAARILPMASPSHVPDDPESIEWDVVVVGTGMGGATAGYALAKAGRSVLFLEKGRFLHEEVDVHGNGSVKVSPERIAQLEDRLDDRPAVRMARGRWPLRLQGTTSFGTLEFFAPLGCGTGGSTALYAAALERLAPADFRPKENYPDVDGSTLPEAWPISYEDLRPYYRSAEELFRVRGTRDPLSQEPDSCLLEPPPLSERDQFFLDSFTNIGLHPYRVHVGCEFVEGCDGCPARLCHRGCKSDSARICLVPALEHYGAKIITQCDVTTFEAEGSDLKRVRGTWNGREVSIRSKIVVLAAGALMSPVLLLNSKSSEWPNGLANRSGLVGRNLMLHASDFMVIGSTKRLSIEGPSKSLAMNDFYFAGGEKLGTIQAVGATSRVGTIMQYIRDTAQRDSTWWKKLASPYPTWYRKLSSPIIRLIALAAYSKFKSGAVWASIVEDLPYHENRVIADARATNGRRFEYRYPEELGKRVRSLRERLAKALGPHRLLVLSGNDNINFGHACGTCRFGDDPETSVLNRNNRAHDVSNLYVVDASFFPSSGGTNPSLTIAANALRVAEAIDEHLT